MQPKQRDLRAAVRVKALLAALLGLCLLPAPLPAAEAIPVGEFSTGSLAGWEPKVFSGETRYEAVELDGEPVLRAVSRGTASGLVREIRVDLEKTPYLNWRWRIERRLAPGDETSRGGDDYAARLYVVVDGGLLFWKTRAVNYVWARTSAAGSHWPNAFAGRNAMMLAVRSDDAPVGVWVSEKRHVADDLKRLFGEALLNIDAVALMTDTDNAGGETTAYYGDIFFSAE